MCLVYIYLKRGPTIWSQQKTFPRGELGQEEDKERKNGKESGSNNEIDDFKTMVKN